MRTDAQTMSRAGITCMLLLVIAGCVRVPDGVETVDGFELERYLGTWYEIARLDHSFERGLSSVTATYSLREDGGVRVVNRGYNGSEGIWDEAEGKAYLAGAAGTGLSAHGLPAPGPHTSSPNTERATTPSRYPATPAADASASISKPELTRRW